MDNNLSYHKVPLVLTCVRLSCLGWHSSPVFSFANLVGHLLQHSRDAATPREDSTTQSLIYLAAFPARLSKRLSAHHW